jgi:hypothetical protein
MELAWEPVHTECNPEVLPAAASLGWAPGQRLRVGITARTALTLMAPDYPMGFRSFFY